MNHIYIFMPGQITNLRITPPLEKAWCTAPKPPATATRSSSEMIGVFSPLQFACHLKEKVLDLFPIILQSYKKVWFLGSWAAHSSDGSCTTLISSTLLLSECLLKTFPFGFLWIPQLAACWSCSCRNLCIAHLVSPYATHGVPCLGMLAGSVNLCRQPCWKVGSIAVPQEHVCWGCRYVGRLAWLLHSGYFWVTHLPSVCLHCAHHSQ